MNKSVVVTKTIKQKVDTLLASMNSGLLEREQQVKIVRPEEVCADFVRLSTSNGYQAQLSRRVLMLLPQRC